MNKPHLLETATERKANDTVGMGLSPGAAASAPHRDFDLVEQARREQAIADSKARSSAVKPPADAPRRPELPKSEKRRLRAATKQRLSRPTVPPTAAPRRDPEPHFMVTINRLSPKQAKKLAPLGFRRQSNGSWTLMVAGRDNAEQAKDHAIRHCSAYSRVVLAEKAR